MQVNTTKPLINTILIGKLHQVIIYEGISRLCFSCGRVGHRREQCQYTVKLSTTAKSDTNNGSPRDSGIGHDRNPGDNHAPGTEDNIHFNHSDEDVYGPWLVVTPKRHGARNNKGGSGSMSPRASFNIAKFQAQGAPP